MIKHIDEYRLIIADMDGTLYYQTPLRIHMACKLLLHIMQHGIRGIREVLLVSEFRKIRENKALSVSDACKKLSDDRNLDYEYVQNIIKTWIMDLPLSALPKYRDNILCNKLLKLSRNNTGIIITVFSDYPASDKCSVLGLDTITAYHGDQSEIGELKPSPKGIEYIMEQYNISDPSLVLMIGDRESRDGKSAEAAGCDKLILPVKAKDRAKIYDKYF